MKIMIFRMRTKCNQWNTTIITGWMG